jgi:hypothetical protein
MLGSQKQSPNVKKKLNLRETAPISARNGTMGIIRPKPTSFNQADHFPNAPQVLFSAKNCEAYVDSRRENSFS